MPPYDEDCVRNKHLLPVVFLLFDDRPALEAVYSFLHYYVAHLVPGEMEKNRVRKCAAKVFEGVFGCRLRLLSFKEGFGEDQLEKELEAVKADTLKNCSLIETEVEGMWEPNGKAMAFDL